MTGALRTERYGAYITYSASQPREQAWFLTWQRR